MFPAIEAWVGQVPLRPDDYLFPSRVPGAPHLSARQYARLVKRWAAIMSRNTREYGTHSLRRAKATLAYRRTKNLRAGQLLPGHIKLERAVGHPEIDFDDALAIAEQTEAGMGYPQRLLRALSARIGQSSSALIGCRHQAALCM